jgi:hypothetical protein
MTKGNRLLKSSSAFLIIIYISNKKKGRKVCVVYNYLNEGRVNGTCP